MLCSEGEHLQISCLESKRKLSRQKTYASLDVGDHQSGVGTGMTTMASGLAFGGIGKQKMDTADETYMWIHPQEDEDSTWRILY
jgi:hypothetical protein